MSGFGRGRGEIKGGDSPPRKRPVTSVTDLSICTSEDSSSSRDSGERTIRGRAGYRQTELNTIPSPMYIVHLAKEIQKLDSMQILFNYYQKSKDKSINIVSISTQISNYVQ